MVQKVDLNSVVEEVRCKVQALHLIENTLQPNKTAADRHAITSKLKELNIISSLAVTDHPEWDNFETIAKKRFQQSHCKRLAIRTEDQVKAFINEPVKPLPQLAVAQVAESHYDHRVFEETVDAILEDSVPEAEDVDLFTDALDHPYNTAGSSVDPEGVYQPTVLNEPVKAPPDAAQQSTQEEAEDDDIYN